MKINKRNLLKFAHRVLIAETNLYKKASESFEEAIKGKKFKHPETKNDVSFGSLPADEQKKIRAEFNKSNPKEDLSKEDQKALDALSDLDLDSDDLAKILEDAAKDLDEFDLSDDDLKELEGMDLDELLGQAEAMLLNDEGAKKVLSEVVDSKGDSSSEAKDDFTKSLESFEFNGDDWSTVSQTIGDSVEAYLGSLNINSAKDLSNLSDDELSDLEATIKSVDEKATKNFNDSLPKVKERKEKAEKEMASGKSELADVEKKLDKILKSFDGLSLEEAEDLEDEVAKLEEKRDELNKKIQEASYDVEMTNHESTDSVFEEFGWDKGIENPNNLLKELAKVQGDRKKQKELEEAEKKSEEEHKQKVKDYTKKINDLISSAESASTSEEASDLWGELGRIKGQLAEGDVFKEVKSDLDKAEKSIKDAQKNNSLSGKFKSFFSRKKKKATVAKIALHVLNEQIRLYKEETKK